MNNMKIRYGIVGTGHIGNYHTQQIQKIDAVILQGIYDTNFTQAKKVAANNNTLAYKSLDDLLSVCDAISIATPAFSHFEIAMAGIKKNCHLFIEKPLTTSISNAERIIHEAKLKNLFIQVGHIERFNPVFLAFIEKNEICNPLFIEAHRLTPFNLRGTDVDVILDLMIHDIDLMLCLVKDSIKQISATGVKIVTQSIDLANARIEFTNGCVANLTASRISVKQMRKLRIFETKYYSSLDLQNYKLDCFTIRNTISKGANLKDNIVHLDSKTIPPGNALYQELVSFINSIQHSGNISVGALEGKKAIQIALQIQQKINEKCQQ